MTTDFQQLADLLGAHRESAALALLDLAPEDVIVVAGAYEGETVAFLHALYPENQIHAYEPQAWAADKLWDRFEAVNRFVRVHNFGLGVAAGNFPMYEFGTDACSFLPLENSRETAPGEMADAAKVISALGNIGLLFMNIEGYEHLLLPYLEGADVIDKCKNVVAQIHQVEKYNPRHLLSSSEFGLTPDFTRVWETKSWIWWKRND